jgi:hypothetical protein
MKFLKENWFKIVIVLAVLIVAISVSYYFVIYFPKYKEEQFVEQKNQRADSGNFSNQEQCAKDSTDFFNKWMKGSIESVSESASDGYISHFNQSLNKCFIEFSNGIGNGVFYELADSVAGTEYAEIKWDMPNEDNPNWCTIYPNGNITDSISKNCSSKMEFDNFVKPYMTN